MTKPSPKAEPASDETVTDFAREEILGARQWRQSKVGYLTGFSTAKETVGNLTRMGRDSGGRISGLFRAAFSQDNSGKRVDESITDSRERFVEAMAINGRTIQHVDRSVDTTYRQFWLYAILIGLNLVLGLGSLVVWGARPTPFAFVNVMLFLARFSPILLLAPLLLRAGWTNWSFRRRRIETLSAYIHSGAIMPKQVKNRARPANDARAVSRVTPVVLACLSLATMAAAMLLGAGDALAQSVADSKVFVDPNKQDLFIRLMAYVIPDTGPIGTPVEGIQVMHTAVKAGFLAFSGTLLFIGMAMSGWQILSGLVASAKEGTALGRNYHEVWAPARVVIGFGMLTPLAGGICGAQILVLYLIVWGGNLANIVYVPYMEKMTLTSIDAQGNTAKDTANVGNMSIATDVIKAIARKEVCNLAITSFMSANGRQAGDQSAAQTTPKWVDNNIQDFASGNGMSEVAVAPLVQVATGRVIDYGPACGRLEVLKSYTASTTAEQKALTAIGTARASQVEQIQANLRTTLKPFVDTYMSWGNGNTQRAFSETGNTSGLTDQLKQARSGYMLAIANAAAEQYVTQNTNAGGTGELQVVRDEAVRNGWAAAGTFYLTAARLQNAVYSATSEGMKITDGNGAGVANYSRELIQIMNGGNGTTGVIPAFDQWWEKNLNVIVPDISEQATRAMEDTTDLGKVLTKVFGGATKMWMMTSSTQLALNPMQSMIDYGNRLMIFGSTTYAAGAIIGATGENWILKGAADTAQVATFGWGSLGSGAMKAASGFGSLCMFLALAIIAAGAMHAYIIPLVPYIMTVFFVASMLVLTVEALVAAPLWAFFHIRMDGQEFIDQVQKPGYMIAFNLILRPSLMIFGLILSHLVFGAMVWFVALTFKPAAMSLAGSTGIGILGFPILVVLMSYLDYQLATRSFQLITQVPDRVTRWFGQGGENLGEDNDTSNSTRFLGAQVSNRIESVSRGAQMAKGRLPGGGGNGKGALEKAEGDTPGGGKPDANNKDTAPQAPSQIPGGSTAKDPGAQI